MSDNENQPPAPSKQTSSVPLKKETVRVTLKAADAPPAAPAPAPVPVKPPVPTAPPVPGAPPAPAAAPAAGAPRPPAPTVPLKPAAAPAAPGARPAPTVKLATTPAATLPGATPTIALPKATVPLQTTPPANSFGSATITEDDDSAESPIGNILTYVGFAAALVVLIAQLMVAGVWLNAEDNPSPGDYTQLFGS